MHKRIPLLFIIFIIFSAFPIYAAEDISANEVIEDEVFDADTEQETETQEIPVLLQNCKLYSESVDSVHVEWDKVDSVNISWTAGKTQNSTSTTSSEYIIKDVPFGETVNITLSTSNDTVSLSCNPSDDFSPSKVIKSSKSFYKNATAEYYYCADWKVYSKNGTLIPRNSVSYRYFSNITSSGQYDITIKFLNKYSKYPSLKETLVIRPDKPTVKFKAYNQTLTGINFSAVNDEKCDFIAEVANNKNYKNASTKKIISVKNAPFEFKGLKRNTQYYVRVKCRKTVNGKVLDSDWEEITPHTTATLTYSWGQSDVKKIVALVKKNKTFSYKFNGYYNSKDVYNIIGSIAEDYPQYAQRYDSYYDFSSGKITVCYKANSAKTTKYKKATKVIDSIVKGAKKKKGVRARIKYVNSRICKTCSYRAKGNDDYTLYGCLVNHRAACMGYAQTFRAIMVQLGIPNTYAYGPDHIWNKVKIGKTWYHVDVTWNDAIHSSKYLLKKKHK